MTPEAKTWEFTRGRFYVTFGPFSSQSEADAFRDSKTEKIKLVQKIKEKHPPTTLQEARAALDKSFPDMLKAAERYQDHFAIDTILTYQFLLNRQESDIARRLRPISEILKEYLTVCHRLVLTASLSELCILCEKPIKAHTKPELKKHLANICRALNNPKFTKLEIVTPEPLQKTRRLNAPRDKNQLCACGALIDNHRKPTLRLHLAELCRLQEAQN